MKKQYLQYFLIIFVLLVPGCAKDLTSQEHLAKAREYSAAGDYSSANIELKNAARKDPNNAEARYELAGLAMILGDAVGAEAAARRALELGRAPEDVAMLLVKAAFMQGEYDKVLAETENLPAEMDDSARGDLLGYRALALMQQQKYRLADSVINIALEIAEDSEIAVLAKASYEAKVGRLDTAEELALRAVQINPDSVEAWALLGEVYAAQGDLLKSRDAHDKAVDNQLFTSILWARRAFILAQLDDFAAAEADIQKLLDSAYKKHPYVNFVKGYIEFRQSRYPEATAALELSVAGNPKDPRAKSYLVASYIEEGKLEQAQLSANQLYHNIPNSIEVARMLASIDIKKQDFSAAQTRLAAVLEVQEDDEVALGMLGSMALLEGDGDQAVAYFERFLALSPDDAAVKKLLRRAMTLRGDFVSDFSAKAERQVAPEEFDEVLISAAAALEQGQLAEALAITENLQQQFPDNVEPLKMLATIYLFSGDWRTAKLLCEDVLSMEPLEPSATKTLAKIYLRTGEEERAIELISTYLQDNPRDQEANGILAQAVVVTNDYEQSEVMLTKIIDRDPDNLEVNARLTKLYFDQGKYQQVVFRTEGLNQEVIRAQPSLIELRGKSLVQLGDYERAIDTWARWVKVSPDSVLANFYHAEALARSNQTELALEFLEKSRELNPDYIPARIGLVRMRAESGDLDTAFVEMKRLKSELAQERADVWYTQGWLNAKAGNYDDAILALNKALSLKATPQAAALLFSALNTEGRTDEALASLEKWSEKFPTHVGILTLRGQTYLARKDTDQAEKIYRRILEIDPVSVRALNNLAWLLQDTDLSSAIEYAERAVAAAPDDPVVLSTLATLREKDGQN